jgi:hypothetical protein
LIAQSDMLIVLSEISADGCQITYEYRLSRLRRLLGVEKISCAHQNEPERRKKPLAAVRHAPAAMPLPVSLLTALGDARRRSRGREVLLRQLKTAPPPAAAAVEQPAERTEDALAA